MRPDEARELAARHVSGERLTPGEEQSLRDWLRDHPDERAAFLADEEMDGLIRDLNRLQATEEAFVAATLGKLANRPASRAAKPWPRVRWLVAAVALVLIAVGVRLATQRGTPHGFARLARADHAVWDVPHAVGDRLDAGTLRLLRGTAVIEYDSGTTAALTAPGVVELRGPDEMNLTRGTLAARVPAKAANFTVLTPVSRLVDRGTAFDIAVGESGAADVHVKEGEVTYRPQRPGDAPGKEMTLAAHGLNRAASSTPKVRAPLLPIFTTASGRQGHFAASISADGRTLEFTDREAFEASQTVVNGQLTDSPDEFRQRWSILTDVPPPAAHAGSFHETATVAEDGNTMTATHDTEGITVVTTRIVNGKSQTTEVKAATAAELKKKNQAAFEVYQKLLGNKASALDAGTALRAQLLRLRGMKKDNRAMQELLDRMLRALEGDKKQEK
ncbi:MAG: hypothetical protein ACRC33_08885 [Gemmataceae bacterium]